VFGGGGDQTDLERPPAPHAFGAVAFEDDRHPFPTVELPYAAHTARFAQPHTRSETVRSGGP
jgi:hypothetical protein